MRNLHVLSLTVLAGALVGYFLGIVFRGLITEEGLSPPSGLVTAAAKESPKKPEVFHVLIGDHNSSAEELWDLFLGQPTNSAAAKRSLLLRLLEDDPESTLDRLAVGVSELSDADMAKTAETWVRRNPGMLAEAWTHRETLQIDSFSELAGVALAASVDVQINNISKLATGGSIDEAKLLGRFALSGLASGAFSPEDLNGDTAKLIDFLQAEEFFGAQERRALRQGLEHRWSLVPETEKLKLSEELAQLPTSSYRDMATITLINHYLESGILPALSSTRIQSLFNAMPRSDQSDTLLARTLDKLSSDGDAEKAIEVFNQIYPNPTTPWERMLETKLTSPGE